MLPKKIYAFFQNILILTVTFALSLLVGEFLINKFLPHLLTEKKKYISETEGFRQLPVPKDIYSGYFKAFPIWGFVGNNKFDNNYGIQSSINYPYVSKSDKKVIVGVFGASVAEAEVENLKKAVLSAPAVTSLIKQGFDVKVLNFAIGGSRQPQQFNMALHFIDDLDVFVTIDGYNEVVFDPGAHYPVDFPMSTNAYYFFDAERVSAYEKLIRLRQIQHAVIDPLNSDSFFYGSTIYFLLARNAEIFLTKTYLAARAEFFSLDNTKIIDPPSPPEKRSKELIQLWSKYARLQELSLKSFGKESVHVVQPNPSFVGSKIFTEEEQSYLRQNSDYENALRHERYQNLIVAAAELNRQGIRIFDLTQIFKNVSSTVYIDSCCHLNQAGRDLLAQQMRPHVVDSILKAAQKNAPPRQNH